MNTTFYKAFEDRHRGTRELIKSRLRVYLPFINELKSIYPDCHGVDLGCGRGEWLELMAEEEVNIHGVDVDNDMLNDCMGKGLSVEKAEGVTYLNTLDDDSQSIVSAFHLVEHIDFEDLQVLVQEALRVLKPAGLLILETPNPENIIVGTSNFYLDPTHIRPIPPELLTFLPGYFGFCRSKILRLQDSSDVLSGTMTLTKVLSSVSPDYAIIAQKHAEEDALALFDESFEKEYGISLNLLMNRFDQEVEARTQVAEQKTQEAEARTQVAEQKTQEAEARTQVAEQNTQEALVILSDVYSSKSWRITAPIRRGLVKLRSFFNGRVNFKNEIKGHTKKMLQHTAYLIRLSPVLKKTIKQTLVYVPGINQRLTRVILNLDNEAFTAKEATSEMQKIDVEQMSPEVVRIYKDLKHAIEMNVGKREC